MDGMDGWIGSLVLNNPCYCEHGFYIENLKREIILELKS